MDEQYRRYNAGKYSEGEDFTPSDEENRKMKKKQTELDDSFGGPAVDKVKALRAKSRKALEDTE